MSKRIVAALTTATIFVLPACQRNGAADESRPSAVRGTAPLVQDYLHLAEASGAETGNLDEQVLADALRKLAAALGTLSLADVGLQTALRVAAEHVVSNPQSVQTTVAVRDSLIAAAQAIASAGRGGGELQHTAASLRPDRPLADQTATLREFLHRSSPLIRQAAGT